MHSGGYRLADSATPARYRDGSESMKSLEIVEPEVGRTVLFSLVYEESKGDLVRNDRYFGTVTKVKPQNGLIEDRKDFYIGKTVIIGVHHYLHSDPAQRILRHQQLFEMIGLKKSTENSAPVSITARTTRYLQI